MSVQTSPYGTIGALGQGETPITQREITSELNNRGYTMQAVVHHVPVHHVVTPPVFKLSRAQAIMIGCDAAIEGYNLPRGYTHPFVCPSSGCPVEATTWGLVIQYAVDAANGLLTGKYGLPDWFRTMMNLHGMAGVGAGGYALGGFSDWIQENAFVVTAIGAALTVYGQYLTAKQAKQALEENIPKDYLTKENLPAILAALQAGGAIQPGTLETVNAGATAATSPDWLMPVMIGAGVLVVMMLMKR